MAFFIAFVLGEHAAQISLARLGRAVGLFAFASRQFLPAHGHSGAIAADIQNARIPSTRLAGALLPGLRLGSHPLHHPLDLPGGYLNAARLGQMVLGLLEARFIRPFQTDQPGQSRSISDFQAQGGVGRIMPLFFAGMVIVIAPDGEAAKETLHLKGFPAFALFARFGLEGGVAAVGGLLQQHPDQRAGGLENGSAHQHFQLLHQLPAGLLILKMGHQPLDFLILGQEDFGCGRFFLKPDSRSARVLSTMSWTYCAIISWT